MKWSKPDFFDLCGKWLKKIKFKRRWRIFLLFHYSIIILSYLTTTLSQVQPIYLPLSVQLFLLPTLTVICWLGPTTPYTLSMFARGWHSILKVQKKRGKDSVFGQRVMLRAFWRLAALWFKSLPVQLLSERNRAEQHLHERNRFYLALYMTMFWNNVTCWSKIMNIRNNWP